MTIRSFLAAVALACATLLSLHCGSEPEPPSPDVLLITIDTLRADALGTYGASDSLTPNIDQLAHDGVVYEAASTPMPLTRPAHGSILTGLYPDQHGVLTNHQILPEWTVTLAETLGQAGYQTAAFTGVRFLDQKSGFAQGFVDFDAPGKGEKPRAKDIVNKATEWLAGADPERPILLWVHVYDPHQPYNPLPRYRRGINPKLRRQLPVIRWESLNRIAKANRGEIPAKVLELALDYYRGEIEYTDAWIGKLLKSFDRTREARHSMVLLTSDHGECFENGFYFEHAGCLYEGALRVPLIVRYPNGVGAGDRVERRVSILDITPTVLRQLSMPISGDIAGLPLQEHSIERQRQFAFFRTHDRDPNSTPPRLRVIRWVGGEPVAPATDPRTRGVVDRTWKYLWTPGAEHLFQLPDEVRDLSNSELETLRRLREALEAERERFPARAPAMETDDEETLEMLKTLGYLQ